MLDDNELVTVKTDMAVAACFAHVRTSPVGGPIKGSFAIASTLSLNSAAVVIT